MAEVRSINALRAERAGDNSLLSPVECLQDAVADLESGERKANKALILLLDDEDGAYNFGFRASNLRSSEMIALLEKVKMHVAMLMSDG